MHLGQLLRALPSSTQHSSPNSTPGLASLEISLITDRSRSVTPGALFVAYPGVNVDGAQFIPDAIQRGARAIVSETSVDQSLVSSHPDVAFVQVPNGRAALAHLAAAWHNFPSRNLRVIGVTGTDGKTTTSTLIENILLAAGHTVGTITTVAAHIGGKEMDTGFHTTTPDAPEIQAYLAQMVGTGTEYAVVEATSHGLAQHRLHDVDIDVAVVTNITHEHLDLHGTWENYRDAKAILFQKLITTRRKPRTPKVAVLNADDNERGVFEFLRGIPADEKVVYTTGDGRRTTLRSSGQAPDEGRSQTKFGRTEDERRAKDSAPSTVNRLPSETWIAARDIHHSSEGLRFIVETPFGELGVQSPLIGRYNVSNILAAMGAAIARRVPFDAIAQGVRMTRGVTGRMERIDSPSAPRDHPEVIVDFAHTPNALANALETAGDLTSNRVIVVFGCAGLRDVQKRAWMGEIAGTRADLIVVTAEDPRTESLDAINAEIARGLEKAGKVRDRDYFVVNDRGAAIDFAINQLAQPGDVVMICGKGHERSMCFGTTEYPWSDQETAQEALEKK